MSRDTSLVRKIKILDKVGEIIPGVYLLKNHRNIAHPWVIARDYFKLKNNFYFLKDKPPSHLGKKVLVVSLTHFIYQVKIEAMLAKALQLAGGEVVVLTWRHFFWPKKYFRLWGIDKFVYFEDYLKKFKQFNYGRELDGFLQKKISFQEVKKWQFRDCRLGQQVLSALGRRMHGTPSFEPPVYDLFVYYLRRQMKAISAAEVMLEDVKPDTLIFNEANDSIYGGIFDLGFKKGIDAIQVVHSFRDDAFIFKRYTRESKGLHPNSLSRTTFEKVKSFSWTPEQERTLWQEFSHRYGGRWFLSQRNQPGVVQKTKEDIIKHLGLAGAKKTAIIFSHVLWDANLFYGEDLFEDYEDWFVQTLTAAGNNPGVNWIVKLHPSNIWKRNRDKVDGPLREITLIREKIGRLPGHIFLLYPDTDISTFSLFNLADYAVTVRGTVGMEVCCFGVPVFTAGTGRYSGLGFTVDSASREEYLAKLSKIQDFPLLSQEQTLLAKKHAYAVFNRRPWKMDSFRAEFNYKKKGSHPLDHNLYPQISSFRELSGAQDLKRFSHWVLNSKESDYLAGVD